MVTITDAAAAMLQAHIEAKTEKNLAVRLTIIGRGKEGFRYDFRMVFHNDLKPDDQVVKCDGFDMLIDAESWTHLDGAVLDLKADGGSFKIENPNPVWTDPKGPLILDLIENHINPGVALHGGQISLIDVKDDVVYISFGGGCQGCGLANVTLKEGVHKLLKEAVPEIKDIVDLTDHALGVNPFYRPGATGRSPMKQTPTH